MLGTEPQVIETYVHSGQAKVVFWPVLNHGNPSVYSTVTAHCAGEQDPDKFWEAHEQLFSRQSELWRADRDFYVEFASSLGLDQAAFESCYDGGEVLAQVLQLDDVRRQRGIAGQPIFDIGGAIYGGAPPFEAFAEIVDATLAEQSVP